MADLLHIYGQKEEHDGVRIIGTRSSIEKLLKTLQNALEQDNRCSAEFFVNDGEEFTALVIIESDERMMFRRTPYTHK